MKKTFDFLEYYLDKELIYKGIKKIKDDEVSLSLTKRTKLLSPQETNQLIHDAIISGQPFLAGRFGANELSMMKTIEFDVKSKYKICTEMMYKSAGFFPNNPDTIKGFLPLMIDFCRECDLIGTWSQPFEGYFIQNYMRKEVALSRLNYLEPWYAPQTAWSAALKSKKVLVIHPFAETIKSQYQKRLDIFPDTNILPEFDLYVLKAVQTIAGVEDLRFKSWYEALDWMYEQAMMIDFDVAIIGCGAYGAPLAMKIKKAGKQAIHLGGATQILFGIKGNRWLKVDFYEYVRNFMNEQWTFPKEKIKNSNIVENSCYWGNE